MANPQRGEIEAILNGKPYTLCLTLGALAELEAAFDSETLIEVIERFQANKIHAADLIAVITAGLKGAGHDLTQEEVAAMQVEGGVTTYIAIVAKLLNATFANEAP